VLLNQSESEIEYAVTIDGRQTETSIAPSALQTVILD